MSDGCLHPHLQVCTKIGEMVAAPHGLGPALTANDVAGALAVPLAIASEHILTAESRGVLCRDDGQDGLRWYRNFFATTALAM